MVRRLIATVAATIVVAGCAAPSPTPGPSDSAPQSFATSPGASGRFAADLFTAPPNILNLSVTTEDASAVVRSIGPDGGQLSTKAADGTTYTLDIPSGAVLFAEDISMTPVVEVDGLPGDIAPAHIVGVRLDPDGLGLYAPGTLRITPPSSLPEAGVATLSFYGDGDDAGLVLFDHGASEIVVNVEHFSGYASFWPVDEEWWRQFERLRQKKAADNLRNNIASVLGVEQQKQMLGLGEPDLAELLKGLAALFDRDVLDALRRNAANGCREATDAVAAYVVWERQLQLLGVSLAGLTPEEYSQATDDQRELYERMRRDPPPELLTLKRDLCFEEQFQRCRQTGDFEHLAGFFLSHFRQLDVLGKDVSSDDIELAHLYLERCGRWDLTMESIEDFGAGGSNALVHQIRTYSIKWQPGGAGFYGLVGTRLIGEGATEIVGVAVTDPRCRVTNTYQGTAPLDTAEIERLIFDEPENAEPVPRKVHLGFSFGDQTWTTSQVCPDLVHSWTYTLDRPGNYLPTVLYVHDLINKREWRFGSGLFGNGPFSAEMTITDSFTDTMPLPPVSVDVEVIITLEHTPAP